MSDLAVIAGMAAVWWVPTFLALTDLQRRVGIPRPLVWRWTAWLCVPVLGAVLYFRRGRAELDRVSRP